METKINQSVIQSLNSWHSVCATIKEYLKLGNLQRTDLKD
jgi:hypothetical protein